jgi:hypothetical protein
MQYVLNGVEPLYAFFRFVDQDKISKGSSMVQYVHR